MARSGVKDPLDKFRWTVDIPGFSKLGFMQCAVPRANITPKEYAEGGSHLNPKLIVDRMAYVPVTFTRGVTNDTSFNKWATSCMDLVQNNAAMKSSDSFFASPSVGSALSTFQDNGAESVPSNETYPFNYRKQVKMEHVNRAGQVEVIYVLSNVIVLAYQPASDFDAMSDEGMSIETLVLGYEGFDVKYTGLAGFAGNLLASSGIL